MCDNKNNIPENQNEGNRIEKRRKKKNQEGFGG